MYWLFWTAPTDILYGRNDDLTAHETIEAFAREHGVKLTVMETAGHWFHTPEEMRFLNWPITHAALLM